MMMRCCLIFVVFILLIQVIESTSLYACNVNVRLFEISSLDSNQLDKISYVFSIYPNCDKNLDALLITYSFDNFTSYLGEDYDNQLLWENKTMPYLTWYRICNPSIRITNYTNEQNDCILNQSDIAGIFVVFSYDPQNINDAPSLETVLDDLKNNYITLTIINQNDEFYYNSSEHIYVDVSLYSPLISIEYEDYVSEFDSRQVPENFYTNYLNCSNHSQCSQPCSKTKCFSGFCTANISQLTYYTNQVVCRPQNGSCDLEEKCTGNSSQCPTDLVKNEFQICRQSEGDCDPEELCDGLTKTCPTDVLEVVDTVCRNPSGPCEMPGVCSGTSPECPPIELYDFISKVEPCREASTVCDSPEYCDGVQSQCPDDQYSDMFTLCRASVGACDRAEYCNETSKECPNDNLFSNQTVCRNVLGACDVAENCTGSSPFCPVDRYKPNTFVCRPVNRSIFDNSTCDVEEKCTGHTPQCPTDEFMSSGTVCRPKVSSTCDIDEKCTGLSSQCPPDLNKAFMYMYQCGLNLYVCGVTNIVTDLKIPFIISNKNNFKFLNQSFHNVQYVHYLSWPQCMVDCYETTNNTRLQTISNLCKHGYNPLMLPIRIIEASCVDGDNNFASLSLTDLSLHSSLTPRLSATSTETHDDYLNNNGDKSSSYTMSQTVQLSHLKEAIASRKKKYNTNPSSSSKLSTGEISTSKNDHIVKDNNNVIEQKNLHKKHHKPSPLNSDNSVTVKVLQHEKRNLETTTVSWHFLAIRTIGGVKNLNQTNICPFWIEHSMIDPTLYSNNLLIPSNFTNNNVNQNSNSNNIFFSIFTLLISTLVYKQFLE